MASRSCSSERFCIPSPWLLKIVLESSIARHSRSSSAPSWAPPSLSLYSSNWYRKWSNSSCSRVCPVKLRSGLLTLSAWGRCPCVGGVGSCAAGWTVWMWSWSMAEAFSNSSLGVLYPHAGQLLCHGVTQAPQWLNLLLGIHFTSLRWCHNQTHMNFFNFIWNNTDYITVLCMSGYLHSYHCLQILPLCHSLKIIWRFNQVPSRIARFKVQIYLKFYM